MIANQAAFDVGRLAQRLAEGYYAYVAAIQAAQNPQASTLAPTTPPGASGPEGYVFRRDGTRHTFDFHHYLAQVQTNSRIGDDLPRVWLVGSVLAVGEELKKNDYFDHDPVLELLYHLRNGIAHGNTFEFKYAQKRLREHPDAHNKQALVRSPTNAVFEIRENLQGQPVLFDFMGPGDVLDLLQSIERHLARP